MIFIVEFGWTGLDSTAGKLWQACWMERSQTLDGLHY